MDVVSFCALYLKLYSCTNCLLLKNDQGRLSFLINFNVIIYDSKIFGINIQSRYHFIE